MWHDLECQPVVFDAGDVTCRQMFIKLIRLSYNFNSSHAADHVFDLSVRLCVRACQQGRRFPPKHCRVPFPHILCPHSLAIFPSFSPLHLNPARESG